MIVLNIYMGNWILIKSLKHPNKVLDKDLTILRTINFKRNLLIFVLGSYPAETTCLCCASSFANCVQLLTVKWGPDEYCHGRHFSRTRINLQALVWFWKNVHIDSCNYRLYDKVRGMCCIVWFLLLLMTIDASVIVIIRV